MSAQSSWSMKGASSQNTRRGTRSAVDTGVTVGDWINRKILSGANDVRADASTPEGLAAAIDRLSRRIEATEHRSTLAITGIDQTVLGLVSRMQAAEGEQLNLEQRHHQALEDLTNAREALLARIDRLENESSSSRNLDALRSLEASLARLSMHVADNSKALSAQIDRYGDEIAGLEDHLSEASEAAEARFAAFADVDDALNRSIQELSEAQAAQGEKLDSLNSAVSAVDARVDDAAERTARASQSAAEATHRAERVESALSNESTQREAAVAQLTEYADRLSAAEQVTNSAIRSLEDSFKALESRVRSAESGVSEAAGLRAEFGDQLCSLGRELGELVDSTRETLAARLQSVASEQRVDAIEARLDSIMSDISLGEQQRAEALDRIVMELAKVSDAVDQRIRETGMEAEARVEQRAHMAIKRTETAAHHSETAAQRSETAARMAQDAVGTAEQRMDDRAKSHIKRLEKVARAAGEGSTMRAELEARIKAMETKSRAELGAVRETVDDLGKAHEQTQSAISGLSDQFDDLAGRASQPGQAISTEDLDQRIRDSEQRTKRMIDDIIARSAQSPEPKPTAAPSQVTEAILGLDLRLSGDFYGKTTVHNLEPTDSADPDAAYIAGLAEGSSESPDDDTAFAPVALPGRAAFGGDNDFGEKAKISTTPFDQVDVSDDIDTPFDEPDPDDDPDRISGFDDSDSEDEVWPSPDREGAMFTRDTLENQPGLRTQNPVVVPKREDSGLGLGASLAARTGQSRGSLALASGMAFTAVGAATYLLYEERAVSGAQPNEADIAHSTGQTTGNGAALIDVTSPVLQADLAKAGNDVVALYNIGVEHLQAERDERGAALILIAAEQGLADAQHHIGMLYSRGVGVNADQHMSRTWTERAANAGHPRAMHDLGVKFANAKGAPQSYEQALRWFEDAALLGVVDSQYNLGVLYEQGLGAPTSIIQAHAWYSLAASGGDQEAQTRADELARTLTRRELEASRAKAAQLAEKSVSG